MKKLFLIPILLASLFLCACQASDEDDYTSKLRLNITHIDESDDEKEIHISYPVFGGIENKEAVTIINTSISNFVNSQYDEFQNALTSAEQDALSDTGDLLGTDAAADTDSTDVTTDTDSTDEEDNQTDSDEEATEGDTDESASADKDQSDKITLSMTFKITYNKNNYIGIVQTYQKNLGKDKDFNGQRSFFFSLENASYLSLGEIFDFEGEFPAFVNARIKEELNNGAYATYDDNSGFTGISKNSKYYIDNNNLYIFYDALEISPDKESIPTFAFKLSEVKSYANEEFANIF